jgi:hypothetical protein
VVEKAAKLDRDTFGAAVGQGPWVRGRGSGGLRRSGAGIKPLAFGQFLGSRWAGGGPGLGHVEVLLASAATAAEASCRPHASGTGRGGGLDDGGWGAGYGGDVGRVDRQ